MSYLCVKLLASNNQQHLEASKKCYYLFYILFATKWHQLQLQHGYRLDIAVLCGLSRGNGLFGIGTGSTVCVSAGVLH